MHSYTIGSSPIISIKNDPFTSKNMRTCEKLHFSSFPSSFKCFILIFDENLQTKILNHNLVLSFNLKENFFLIFFFNYLFSYLSLNKYNFITLRSSAIDNLFFQMFVNLNTSTSKKTSHKILNTTHLSNLLVEQFNTFQSLAKQHQLFIGTKFKVRRIA